MIVSKKNYAASESAVNKLLADLRAKSAQYWISKGKKMALKLFLSAAKNVPAYKDFLKKNGVKIGNIKTASDFQRLPLTNKENYIKKYTLAELCWGGKIPDRTTVAESSGTSGPPNLWPRDMRQEHGAALMQGALLAAAFNTYKVPTLFIVCFHLGAHIAGMITVDALKRLLDGGMPGTLVTPGLNKNDSLYLLEKLGSGFKQVIFFGYPPFLKDLVEEGISKKINWKKYNVKYIFSGESITEKWRTNLEFITDCKGVNNSLNLYGSADVGLIGFETDTTKLLRNAYIKSIAKQNPKDKKHVYAPAFYQFNPQSVYIESINEKLIFTTNKALPLIKYDLKDVGTLDVLPTNYLNKFKNKSWNFPIVKIYGRSDNTVTYYGVNIYPEHIRSILNDNNIKTLTGKFYLRTAQNLNFQQQLQIYIELNKNVILNKSIRNRVEIDIVKNLKKINQEYEKLTQIIGSIKSKPRFYFARYGTGVFKDQKIKNKYLIK